MFPAIYLCLTWFSILFRLLPNIQMAYNLFISTCIFCCMFRFLCCYRLHFVCQLGSLRMRHKAQRRRTTQRAKHRQSKRESARERKREKAANAGCTLSCVLYTQTCKMPVSFSSGGFSSQFTRFKRKENALEFNFNLICCTKINVRRCQRIHWNR